MKKSELLKKINELRGECSKHYSISLDIVESWVNGVNNNMIQRYPSTLTVIRPVFPDVAGGVECHVNRLMKVLRDLNIPHTHGNDRNGKIEGEHININIGLI